jgi:hypothetical protein
METRRTFRAGESLESLAQFVRVAADEMTGESGAAELPSAVRITVSTIAVHIPRSTVIGVVAEVGIDPRDCEAIADKVEEFLDYRRDEKRSPIRTVTALRRLLNPFEGKPAGVLAAIDESMRQGWTGLFIRDAVAGRSLDRIQVRGESSGGTF